MKNKNKGLGKLIFGAGLGAGAALLFSTKKGEKVREELKKKLDELLNNAKEIDLKEINEEFNKKVEELKIELQDLDKEKALKLAKEKSEILKSKAEELYALAKEKGTPVLESIAKDVKKSTASVIKEVLNKLENEK